MTFAPTKACRWCGQALLPSWNYCPRCAADTRDTVPRRRA